jgi:Fibronectin type III domain/Dockerin type I domain
MSKIIAKRSRIAAATLFLSMGAVVLLVLSVQALARGKKSQVTRQVTSHKVTNSTSTSSTLTSVPLTGVPRFFVYMSPQGVADSAGEPSIGSNWTREATDHNTNLDGSINDIPNGGTSLYFGGFLSSMVKVTWDDCSSPAGTLWENKPLISASSPHVFGDPILFTDHDTGRTFCGQLEGLTPAGCTIDITDDDGDTFTPSDGVIPSDVDHETIGGGRYHSPLPNPGPVYSDAIYYASQSITDARALRSDDGGLTFSGATTPMFTIDTCSGLHGHIKVSPADGTVYVPDKGCGGTLPYHENSQQTLVVSEDNGLTWTTHPIPDSTSHGENQASHDPSVGVATDGTVYFGYQDASGHPKIAVTHDNGVTWSASYDVGANVVNGGPVLNCAFPAVVAGDGDRAAFAFFGTETGGDNWHCGNGEDCSPEPPFAGVWYLYVATTLDGGQTWTTQNITPGDPIQRSGICGGGTCRNLLDFFDMTIDKEGRIVIGYDDGCISATCIAGDPSITAGGGQNDYTAKGAIARQSGGPRMFAAYDPQEPTVPGAPALTASLNATGDTATLSWATPDNGGALITGYNIYRSTNGGAFTLLATVPVTTYQDTALNPGDQYTYHVTAVNGSGESPFCNNVTPTAFTEVATPCTLPGILAVNDLNPDGTDNDSGVNTPPDPTVNIRQLFVGEPFFGAGVNKLVFTMQLAPSTASSPPVSSQWYIVWNRQGTDPSDPNDADYDRLYVAMKTDATGALSFEYGKFGVALDPMNPNPQANTPTAFGSADSGTYDLATGVVVITISNSKLQAIDGGSSKYVANTALSAVNVRTYLARPDGGQRSQNNANDITGDGSYTLAGNASCALPVPFLGAASRKTHGTAGTFDVGLPLTGNPGIECRTGGANGDFTVVFTFANAITSVGSVDSSGGSVGSSGPGSDAHEYIVNLTGVANASRTTVTLNNVVDTAGNSSSSISATMGVLAGDTNADGTVNSADISQTKSQSGNAVTSQNFREDVNADGFLNSADISLVKSKSGTALP